MFELERSLLTKRVVDFVIWKIDQFHETFVKTRLNSFQWEDVLSQALSYEHGNSSVQYDGIAGQSGYDIICNGIRISCKSGQNQNKISDGIPIPCLLISSYRLKTYKTWEDKVSFMKEQHEDSFFCLNSNFIKCSEESRVVYALYVFPQKLVDMATVIWTPHNTPTTIQQRGLSESKIYYTIKNASGEQLWIHIPIDKMWKVFSYETDLINCNKDGNLSEPKGNFLCLSL